MQVDESNVENQEPVEEHQYQTLEEVRQEVVPPPPPVRIPPQVPLDPPEVRNYHASRYCLQCLECLLRTYLSDFSLISFENIFLYLNFRPSTMQGLLTKTNKILCLQLLFSISQIL